MMSIEDVQKEVWFYVLDEPTRVLVADDDPILREFASVHLSSPVATITTVGDGAAALAALERDTFDIAILDISMPELDGFSVLEKVRIAPKLCHLPVVMLTGTDRE
jgi:CheY-like chemotaxis protein